ncbi:unnamed protein product, partial [Prorocentrum cordatum]
MARWHFVPIVGGFAEGVSTGLVVWAGRPTCPQCECSPVLNCPPLTCSTGDVAYTSPLTPFTLAFTCTCVAVVAFAAGRLTGVRVRTELNPEGLGATARAQVAQYRSKVGDFCVVRYNVGGPHLYHERLVTYLPLGAGLTVSVTTPDGDEYEEVWSMPDIVEWEPLPHRQQGGVLLGRPGARYYRFRVGAMPTAASLTASTTAAAARLGQPAPVGPVAPALGGRIAELPAGGAVPGAPVAGGAVAPPDAVPGQPAAAAGAALGGVAPAAGLGGLVAALGGPAAGAPAGVLVPAPLPPAAPAAVGAAAAAAPGAGAAPAGAAVGAPLLAAAGAAAAAAPLPAAFGGVPAAAVPAGGHVQDARTLPVVYDMVGNRRREFRDAVLACREDQWEGWPVRGPRTTHWVLRYIVDHGGTPTGVRSRWRSEARLQEHEPGVQEHERACRALEELLCFDQCNGANLAAAELLTRTIQVQQERYQDRSAGGQRDSLTETPVDRDASTGPINREDLSLVTRRRGAATKHILDWGDECINALNDLCGHQDRPAVPANAGQRRAVDHVESRVRALGKPPPEAGFREGALRELLAGAGIYQTGDLSSRRPYVKESISWPSPDLQPVPLAACLGEAESEWLGRWQSTLLRPDRPTAAERAEFCPRGPFFDPSLFSKPLLYADFVAKLLARGMAELKRGCDAATVGCFFVAKKNNKLRVIFDTRYANLFFGRPARTALPTAAALAAFENPGHDTYLASGDIDSAFYRLRLPDGLSSHFRLPALDASLLGITHLDGVPIARGARVQPCVCVLPMGWNHALALCQGVLRRAMGAAGFTVDQCVEDGEAGVVVDREGALAVAGYVDNYAALGRSPALVDEAALAIARVLTEKGLLTHDEEPAARDATFVGLELKRGRHFSIKARSIWRLRFGLDALLRRGFCSGDALRVIMGHFTWAGLLRREVLSLLNASYQFAERIGSRQAAVGSTGGPDKALENLLVDNPVAFDEAAVERAQNAQLVVASTVQTFGLSVLESAAIRPNAQRQCRDRLATLVLFCRMDRLDWDSWGCAVTALLNHQFLDGKCSDLGAQLIAEVHSDVFRFGDFVMTQFTALVEHGLAGPLFDQAAGNVTHLVHGGDVGTYLGKRLVASLGRAVRLKSLLFLELFGGCGRVAASAQAMVYAALSLDINASPLENHLTPAFLNRILGWISSGVTAGVWLGTPCSAWTRALRAPLRTEQCPDGRPDLSPEQCSKLDIGN